MGGHFRPQAPLEFGQGGFRRIRVGGLVDRFQLAASCFTILPAHVVQRGADQVHDAGPGSGPSETRLRSPRESPAGRPPPRSGHRPRALRIIEHLEPELSFRGHVPYQVIACGQRQDVLDVLGRIEDGIFS